MNNDLQLRFDPRTIEHLGIKMYSRVPSALAELIANAYDANATEVVVELFDNEPDNKRVVITDNGDGMSYDCVNEDFLVIGRKKRDFAYNSILGRKPTGRKGLGKLALFGIGKTIEIKTQERNSENLICFKLDWDSILESSGGVYHPEYDIQSRNAEYNGTSIEVSQLKRSTQFDLNQVVLSIAKLFNIFEDDFKIYISLNGSEKRLITRQDRIDGVDEQFRWNVSDVVNEIAPDYKYKDYLSGIIVSSVKPISSSLRGITLYARGRQANEAGFFGTSEAGHTFSYVTGWIDADFIDEQDEDMISTDRQQVEWDQHELTQELQEVLQLIMRYIVRDWSNKRSHEKLKKVGQKTRVDVPEWLNNVPEKVRPKLESLITTISEQPELGEAKFEKILVDINELVPEYTSFHYRYLHPEVKDAANQKYKTGDYYNAFLETMKRYSNCVREKSGTPLEEERGIIESSFGPKAKLKINGNIVRPDGIPFKNKTIENVEESTKYLGIGVVSGGRNVLSHEEIEHLNKSQLFSEKDCLDYLSLLSHLFKRLDESEKRQP